MAPRPARCSHEAPTRTTPTPTAPPRCTGPCISTTSTSRQRCCDAGAKVDARNRYGVPPLDSRRRERRRRDGEHAARAAAPIANTALPEGETALMTAARTGDVATLAALHRGRRATSNDARRLEGPDGADVGGAREQRAGDRHAARRRGRARRALERPATSARCCSPSAPARSTPPRALLDGRRRRERERCSTARARSCSRPRMPTTSSRRCCSRAARTRTPPRKAGPRCTRSLGRAAGTWASTCPGPAQTGHLDSLELVRRLVGGRRRRRRAADEGARRRQPQQARPARRHAVRARREVVRPAADAHAARARRRSSTSRRTQARRR